MKNLSNFQRQFGFYLSLCVLMVWSCKDKMEYGGAVEGETEGTLRSMQDELVAVGAIADSLYENDKGHWEADFGDGLVMIYVPAGQFNLGNDALDARATRSFPSAPAHPVALSHYWIAKTPVTIGQFRAFVNAMGYVTDVEQPGHSGPWVYDFDEKGFVTKVGHFWDNAFKDVTARFPEITVDDSHVVSCVSWNDARAFTEWLKAEKGLEFTLPTEAEWEFAARGTDGRVYPWGNETPDGTRANYADETFNRYFPETGQSEVHFGVDDGYAITSPVGSFPAGASPVGALDMAGNLTEWIFDSAYDYEEGLIRNPISKTDNGIKLQKAGFWAGSAGRFDVRPNEIKKGHNIRSDARQGDDPNSADDHLGFRIAISYTGRN
ncbi:MAG: SUMF1/EgtB/PvdO family nonheme iron enzyme [Bacteroidota bacterium]